MIQKRRKTIALTTTTTLIGTVLWLGGSFLNHVALSLDKSETASDSATEIVKREGITPTEIQETSVDNIATIQAYQWKEQRAIILRVKDIPVLMFPSPLNDQEAQDKAMISAQKVVNRINELSLQGVDASQITVAWDEKTEGFSIKVEDEELVQVNKSVILPDTTKNLAHDALQATNRLRRLLGNAAPLTEVANLPKPKPVQVATTSRTVTRKNRVRGIRQGVASWYGPGFHGRRTANGERYNQHGLTAAHRYLPFGTKVRVTNLRNNRSVVVRINDRGPFIGGRIIDLSAGAAKRIGVFHSGVAPVKLEILGR